MTWSIWGPFGANSTLPQLTVRPLQNQWLEDVWELSPSFWRTEPSSQNVRLIQVESLTSFLMKWCIAHSAPTGTRRWPMVFWCKTFSKHIIYWNIPRSFPSMQQHHGNIDISIATWQAIKMSTVHDLKNTWSPTGPHPTSPGDSFLCESHLFGGSQGGDGFGVFTVWKSCRSEDPVGNPNLSPYKPYIVGIYGL